MRAMRNLSGECGAAAVEYAILASAIAASIVMIAGTVGLKVQLLFAALHW